MRIAVCLRQGQDGELNPFDASAYEVALSVPDAEVILVSMGPAGTENLLLRLTRLGAARAVLLSDKVFAGADTLATAYALSCAMEKIAPDLIVCGRKTLIGDTGQVPPMLAELRGCTFLPEVLSFDGSVAVTRQGKTTVTGPAVLAVEKQAILRLPSLWSKTGSVEIWTAADIHADPARCGLGGSPTRVLATRENTCGRRSCRFIEPDQLPEILASALQRQRQKERQNVDCGKDRETLKRVWSVGTQPLEYAQRICDCPEILHPMTVGELAEKIEREGPGAVFFGNDATSKATAARLAARMRLGLCADCTDVAVEGGQTVLYRPALSGSLIAKIATRTTPALATVRCCACENASITVAAGYGVRGQLNDVRAFAKALRAEIAVSRRLVDAGLAPYCEQVGLTGRTVSPAVYLAIGISGAVHHIVGMDRSGVVIAVNPDRYAAVFDYADFGLLCKFEEIKELYLC